MQDYKIDAPVGAGRRAVGGNLNKDCDTIRTMLQGILPSRGGTASIAPGDGPLEGAIKRFQARFLKKPDGYIDVGGLTWGRMLEALRLANPPVATSKYKKFKYVEDVTAFHQGIPLGSSKGSTQANR